MSDQKSVSTPFQCCRILFKFLLFMVIISNVAIHVTALSGREGITPSTEWGLGPLVKRGERKLVVSTENGEVSSVRVADGITGSYHLQFITLEPNSLFLPVVLHADMVFYVHTGMDFTFFILFFYLICLILFVSLVNSTTYLFLISVEC